MLTSGPHPGLRALVARILTPPGLALLAFLLATPALTAGLGADDYFHRMVLLVRGPLGAALDPTFDLFSFVSPGLRATMEDLGAVPWWSDPTLRIALARPLTALTHRLDYALWPDGFVLQHLHSLAWFALGVGLVSRLYQKVHGKGVVAGVAGLLFALSDSHALPAAWLANRNALLCLSFGTLMITSHLKWRESHRAEHLTLALCFLAAGLGCGEATLGGLAYVAAWQLTDEKTWRARLMPLAPYGLVVLMWRVLYDRSGYGTHGSTLYVDPGHEPVEFLAQLVQRWPLLVSSQWLKAPVDVWLFLPQTAQQGAALVAVAATLSLIVLLGPLWRRDRLTRFWLLGMALSLVPVCAAFPMDRLLIFASIGGFGSLALLLRDEGVWPWLKGPTGRARRFVAICLLILHVPLAAILLVARTATFEQVGILSARGSTESPKGPEVANQTLVYVNGNDFLVIYTWIMRVAETGLPAPRRVAQLSSLFSSQTVTREDERTLVIRSDGGFLKSTADRVMASSTRPFHKAERIERPDFVAEIRAVTDDHRPLEVAFIFRRDLDDTAYRFLYWRNLRVTDFVLPEVGASVTIRGLLD